MHRAGYLVHDYRVVIAAVDPQRGGSIDGGDMPIAQILAKQVAVLDRRRAAVASETVG
jgi:hypothetical protein